MSLDSASRIWPAALLGFALLSGCSSAGSLENPVPAAPAAESGPVAVPTDSEPVTESGAGDEPFSPPQEPEAERIAEKIVVIEDGVVEGDSGDSDLIAASKRERLARGSREPARIVITDENLRDYATGELSIVGPSEGAEGLQEAGDGGDSSGVEEDAEEARGEEYWRRRVLEARLDWREATDQIAILEARSAQLRWQFYATDDPYYRDSQIKPAWDRALAELEMARQTSAEAEERVGELLEEGRMAGALPGWLREGIDLEPPAAARVVSNRPLDSVEPTILPEAEEPRR